ncbi:MAG: hypothetical protein ABIT08_08935 [Bacteroidia bacterium]
MKKINLIICGTCLIYTGIFLSSCEPEVSFGEAQPADLNELSAFPKSMQGDYSNEKDSSILTILEKEVRRTYFWEAKGSIKDLDTNLHLVDSNLVSSDGTEKIPVLVIGDSFVMNNNFYIDTLFKISENNVLKKYKGYYFLNKKNQENHWNVTRLSLSKGIISTGTITSREKIKALQEITETTDSLSYDFKVTPKQFKKFIKDDGFSEDDTFRRIKK